MKKTETINIEAVADFAARHVATRQDLQTGPEFPMDLWQKMGKAGLFQIGIARSYGGAGGGYSDLLKAGEAFVQNGHNTGLALSWLYQQIIAHYVISTFGTPGQRRQYLPAAAEGKITLSFAVSEPGHGAHPKLLFTRAQKHKTGYGLNGEKTYLTNGPIADIFIVIAVTDDSTPQKRFTPFIVPRDTAGVTVTPPLTLNFLKPSLHGGIKLENCPVGPKSILGKEGNAWRDIVVPFGEIEDVVMMGPALGGMAAQLALLIDAVRAQTTEADNTLQEELGGLHALRQALRTIASETADLLDRGNASADALAPAIAFARLAAQFQTDIVHLQSSRNLAMPDSFIHIQQDLQSLGMLKKRLLQIRQRKIGTALLKV